MKLRLFVIYLTVAFLATLSAAAEVSYDTVNSHSLEYDVILGGRAKRDTPQLFNTTDSTSTETNSTTTSTSTSSTTTTARTTRPTTTDKNATLKPEIVLQDDHDYYIVEYDVRSGDKFTQYWNTLHPTNDEVISHESLQNAHRLAVKVPLKFDFLFYGHTIRSVTIATGGFLYMSEFLHSFLTATQYIAPLMGNFYSSLEDESSIWYHSADTVFTVQWNNVHLQDHMDYGGYTFQAQLHKDSGLIVLLYQDVPRVLSNISDASHPVKVGVSDAFYWDVGRLRTIFTYHTVEADQSKVMGKSAILLKHKKTCNMIKNCASCLLDSPEGFSCNWCSRIHQCSDGFDRSRQEWVTSGCPRNVATTCPATQPPTTSQPASTQPSTTNQLTSNVNNQTALVQSSTTNQSMYTSKTPSPPSTGGQSVNCRDQVRNISLQGCNNTSTNGNTSTNYTSSTLGPAGSSSANNVSSITSIGIDNTSTTNNTSQIKSTAPTVSTKRPTVHTLTRLTTVSKKPESTSSQIMSTVHRKTESTILTTKELRTPQKTEPTVRATTNVRLSTKSATAITTASATYSSTDQSISSTKVSGTSTTVSTPTSSATTEPNTNTKTTQLTVQSTGGTSAVNCSEQAKVSQADCALMNTVAPLKTANSDIKRDNGASIAAGIGTFLGVLLLAFIAFVVYGYLHPQSTSGQCLIRNRPSELARKLKVWKRSEEDASNNYRVNMQTLPNGMQA